MVPEHYAIQNRLIRALPPPTLDRIRPDLHPVDLKLLQVIEHAEGQIPYLYFVNRGLVSLVKAMEDGRTVEIGAVGVEGVTDPNALFGHAGIALMDSVVQVPGTALRIRRDVLRREMERNDAFASLMQRYIHFYVLQIVQTAACNRLHSLEERCCRWLLIAHDSAFSDTFPLTHEFLATMLGVRRSGVSIVANMLRKAGLIDYSRGRITVRNRAGLEDACCECYDVITERLSQLFRP